ncbi:MAG: hypothetical protein GY774_24550 [Planctomycetes bacterium]|nr:hypothetical protein [Planctomycetota bacterium]
MYSRLDTLLDNWFDEERKDEVLTTYRMIMAWADTMVELEGLRPFANEGERDYWWRSTCDRLDLGRGHIHACRRKHYTLEERRIIEIQHRLSRQKWFKTRKYDGEPYKPQLVWNIDQVKNYMDAIPKMAIFR